jgi:anti-sigma regulatory factor (Ser/Thr protein kinase)
MTMTEDRDASDASLRHVALFYRDQAEYQSRILDFVRGGLARGEPSYLVLPEDESRLLGEQLGAEPGELQCADVAGIGRNPARLIPDLQAFVDKHPGQRVHLIGQPAWPGRSAAEICEIIRHEALINLAFSRTRATILCAYDVAQLEPSAIAGARFTHREYLGDYPADDQPAAMTAHGVSWQFPPECDEPLPPPPGTAETLGYDTDLAPVRRLVERHALATRLSDERAGDLVLAASEVAANTLGHTKAGGTLQVWHDEHEIICQAQDHGWIADPLAGRIRRGPDSRGHGLFLVNHVCDLVEIRSTPTGTTLRMHMSFGPASPV